MRRALTIIAVIACMGLVGLARAQPPGPPGVTAADRPGDQGFVIIVTITASPDDGGGANDVVGYQVMRRAAGESFAFLRDVIATGAPEYVITNRVDLKNKVYYYQVRAYDGHSYSTPVIASARSTDQMKPRAPRNPRATDVPDDQGTRLLISFSASPDDGAGADDVVLYRIYRRPPGGSFTLIRTVRANDSPTYSYTDFGLTPNTSCRYRLIARDGTNNSDPVYATGKTLDNRRPRAPRGLVIADRPDDNGDALILTFNASRDDGAGVGDVQEYRISRNPGPAGTQGLTQVAVVEATGAASYTYTDTGLTPKQKYNYVVRAFDGRNLSTNLFGRGTPLDNHAPRPPSNVTVADVPDDNGGVVTVSFQGSPDDGAGADDVIQYEVLRKPGGGTFAPLRTISATDSQLYSFTDTGLINGKTYIYRLRAYDGTRYSTAALGQGAAIDSTAPRPPTAFAVAPTPNAAGSADISFSASVDDTIAHPEVTKYDIYRMPAGGAWPAAPTLTVAATRQASYAVRDAGLTVGGTYYYYRARAAAGTGFSPWTSSRKLVATDSRKPRPPRSLTANDRPDDTGQAVIVRWSRSGDDGTGRNIVARYVLYRKLTSVFNQTPTQVKVVPATGAGSYTVLDDNATELMNLRSYTYWAVAVSGTGVRSDPSNEAEAVPRNDTILAAPTNLAAVDHPGGSGSIDLSWTRSASEGGIGPPPPPPFSMGDTDAPAAVTGDYEVFRRRTGQAWPSTPHMVISSTVSGNPITVTDTQATNGVAFDYKVRFRVDTSISPFSNTASATAKTASVSTAGGASGLSVAIVEVPPSAAVGAPIAVKVRVEGTGLSTVALEWRINNDTAHKAAAKTGQDSYEVTFTLVPGAVSAGDVITLSAAASDATETATSDEAKVEITG